MKTQLLILLITILSFNCYSQIKYQKGYYINNDGQKTDCLIKNVDWVITLRYVFVSRKVAKTQSFEYQYYKIYFDIL